MKPEQLEARYPDNCIILDRDGLPSVMVYLPAFYMDEVLDGCSHTPHPAFVVNGRVLDGIYISKFQNVLVDGLACSLPDRDPATQIDFDTACKVCADKGNGFHLMTAFEWGAIALWCMKNGWLPYGNNAMGTDVRESRTVAKIAFLDAERGICRTATGSGPLEWSHNRAADGIYDLNGNVWEWSGGIRLVRGELQLMANTATAVSASSDSIGWQAIDCSSGALIPPDGCGTTKNSIKLDYIGGAWQFVGGTVTNSDKHARFCDFASVTVSNTVGMGARELLLALGLLPHSKDSKLYEEVALYANNGASERMLFRGGRWGQGKNAGLFKNCFDDPRSYRGDAVGFRTAYYEWE